MAISEEAKAKRRRDDELRMLREDEQLRMTAEFDRKREIRRLVRICVACGGDGNDNALRYLGDGEFVCISELGCAANQEFLICVGCGASIWTDNAGSAIEGYCSGCRYCYKHGLAAWSVADGCWSCRDGEDAMPLDQMLTVDDWPKRAGPNTLLMFTIYCPECKEPVAAPVKKADDWICGGCWRIKQGIKDDVGIY